MPPENDSPCWQAGIKLLSGRSFSEQELRRRLVGKAFDPETVDRVIADLLRRRYLDDVALCQRVFAKYLATGKYGLSAVVARLKQRLFPASVIAEIIKDYDNSQGFQAASDLVNRRFVRRGPTDAAKIGRFLTGRGFSASIVMKVLEGLRRSDDD